MECISSGDTCNGRGSKGAWRLVVRRPRQAVWKQVLPDDSRAMLSDDVEVEALFALDVRGLQGFGETLKVDLLDVP